MAAPQLLLDLEGRWTGTYRLFFEPDRGPHVSESVANVEPVGRRRFGRIDYSWDFGGEAQEGSMLIGLEKNGGAVTAVWVDSWHMSDKVMICEGTESGDGAVEFRGSYAAPPGPDWGWRTVIEPVDSDSFRVSMYNVSPEGKEDLAVDVVYRRTR